MLLEELERRNDSQATTRRYLRFVERFAQHFGKSPDKLSPDPIRTYQAYLLKVRKRIRDQWRTMLPHCGSSSYTLYTGMSFANSCLIPRRAGNSPRF